MQVHLRRYVHLCIRHGAFHDALSVAISQLDDPHLGLEVSAFAMATDVDFAELAASKCKAALRAKRQANRRAQSDGDGGAQPPSEPPTEEAGDAVTASYVAWHASALEALQVGGLPHGDADLRLRASAHHPVVAQMAAAMFVSSGDVEKAAKAYGAAGLRTDAQFMRTLSDAASKVRPPLAVQQKQQQRPVNK